MGSSSDATPVDALGTAKPGEHAEDSAYAEDLALARAVAEGDARACETYARRLLPTVRRVSRGLLRRSDDANDAAQVSLIELLRSASNYAGRGPLEGWARRIATRSTLRWMNKQKRTQERQLAQAQVADLEAHARGSELRTELLDRLPRPLEDYLRQLSEPQRVAVLLRFAMGHTIPEIAELTSTPVPTVKSRIKKGQEELSRLVRRDLKLGVPRAE
ncbi:RNA polymerase sigma factor [Pseudenhygromyxa sp. WMMC2535]|uniref:RNA polymerase sigma factor n=1 Tax=Pseudenhygromyxa sp. WMMC2535 TaxID=2712867 RepID=UPI001595BC75|nr:RNA polymerase sigma factor [Pseudenhygromyxa sp. WMMC2535]NVB39661.1 RNA polymerase sigma factor [Pseudenhygromyxa sp. WMMC2535]